MVIIDLKFDVIFQFPFIFTLFLFYSLYLHFIEKVRRVILSLTLEQFQEL